jgi:hypothetical protein
VCIAHAQHDVHKLAIDRFSQEFPAKPAAWRLAGGFIAGGRLAMTIRMPCRLCELRMGWSKKMTRERIEGWKVVLGRVEDWKGVLGVCFLFCVAIPLFFLSIKLAVDYLAYLVGVVSP